MADDVKIPISVPGAKESKAALDGVADSLHKVGDTAKRSGAEAHAETSKLGDVTHKLAQGVQALVGSYLGLQGVLKLLQGIREEHERELAVTLRQTEAMRGLLALSSLAGQRPEVQAQVQQMAVAAGKSVEQVAPAYYTLLGGTAGMDKARQQGLMQQSLLMSRMDPSASLDSIVNLMATLGTQQPGMSPLQIGNLLAGTLEQAKGTAGEMAGSLPDVLSAARVGGVDPATAAAMFSFATRQGGGVRRSGTAVRAAMMGLMAPTPDAMKAMTEAGMPAAGGLMARLDWLAKAGTNLPPELLAKVGGREGIAAVSAVSGDPGGFAAEIAAANQYMNMPGSLMQGSLAGMFGEVPSQRMLDQINMIKSAGDIESNKPAAMEADMRLEFRDLLAKRRGMGAATRWVKRTGNLAYWGVTGEAIPEIDAAAQAMEDLVVEGYAPQQVLDTLLPAQDRGASSADFRGLMTKAGARTMQAPGATYHGGTHYHNQDKSDPAGKPVR